MAPTLSKSVASDSSKTSNRVIGHGRMCYELTRLFGFHIGRFLFGRLARTRGSATNVLKNVTLSLSIRFV